MDTKENMEYIDEGIDKFIKENGNVDEAIEVLKDGIKKTKGTILEHAYIYAYGKLLLYKN